MNHVTINISISNLKAVAMSSGTRGHNYRYSCRNIRKEESPSFGVNRSVVQHVFLCKLFYVLAFFEAGFGIVQPAATESSYPAK